MHKYVKKLLFGLLIWGIPFIVGSLIWDVEAGVPIVSVAWFNALMIFTWAIGFSIAAYFVFRDVKKKGAIKECLSTGIFWYVEMVVLDIIFLIWVFNMAWADYLPMLLTYLHVVFISTAIGYLKQK